MEFQPNQTKNLIEGTNLHDTPPNDGDFVALFRKDDDNRAATGVDTSEHFIVETYGLNARLGEKTIDLSTSFSGYDAVHSFYLDDYILYHGHELDQLTAAARLNSNSDDPYLRANAVLMSAVAIQSGQLSNKDPIFDDTIDWMFKSEGVISRFATEALLHSYLLLDQDERLTTAIGTKLRSGEPLTDILLRKNSIVTAYINMHFNDKGTAQQQLDLLATLIEPLKNEPR